MSINLLEYKNKKLSVETDSSIVKEAEFLKLEFLSHNLNFDTLVPNSPKSLKLRTTLINVAQKCSYDQKTLNYIRSNGTLPVKRVVFFTLINKKLVKKYQFYILALILMFSNDIYSSICELCFKCNSSEINNYKKGIIIDINKNHLILLTFNGEFVKVTPCDNIKPVLGQEYEGKIKQDKHFLSHGLRLLLLAIILLIASTIRYYTTPKISILIKANSSVRVQLNHLNKIIDYDSLDNSGYSLLKNLKIKNKTVNEGLITLVEKIKSDNYVDDEFFKNGNKINIYISGTKKILDLVPFEEFLIKNKLSCEINNNGTLISIDGYKN